MTDWRKIKAVGVVYRENGILKLFKPPKPGPIGKTVRLFEKDRADARRKEAERVKRG